MANWRDFDPGEPAQEPAAGAAQPKQTTWRDFVPAPEPAPAPPAADPTLGDYASVGIRALARTPGATAASAVSAIQGQSGVEAPGQGDFFEEGVVRPVERDLTDFEQGVANKFPESSGIRTLSRLPRQLGFSLTSMLPGIAAGVAAAPTAAVTGGAGPFIAGSAAVGGAAYRTSSAQIMRSYIDTLDEQMRQGAGRGLTPEETEKAKADFEAKATQYGLWEAIPEAVGGAVAGRLIFGPVKKMVGEKVASAMMSRLGATGSKVARGAGAAAGVLGEELATETVTEIGQSQTLAGTPVGDETPLKWTASDAVEALKTVAPDTLLLTAVLGGGAKGGQLLHQRRQESQLAGKLGIDRKTLVSRIQEVAAYKAANPNAEVSTDEAMQFLAGAVKIGEPQAPPTDEEIAGSGVVETATDEATTEVQGEVQATPEEPPAPTQGVRPEVARVAAKIAYGATEFTPEELQVQQNYPQEVESRLQRLAELQGRDEAVRNDVFESLRKSREAQQRSVTDDLPMRQENTQDAKSLPDVRNDAQGVKGVEALAKASDAALDTEYGYGLAKPGSFGEAANVGGARAAKTLLDAGERNVETLAAAIHEGWSETARTFEDQPAEKKASRLELAAQDYATLPEQEKGKDRVAARAILAEYGKAETPPAQGSQETSREVPDAMEAKRREWIDAERKTDPSFAPDIESWKELLPSNEQAEVAEWEDLRYKSVATQGAENGYKPYKLTGGQKARLQDLTAKYQPRMQTEIGGNQAQEPAPQAEAPVEAPGETLPTSEAQTSLPRLKRGYKRETFTVDGAAYEGNVFVEDTSTKGKKTLLVRRRDGSVREATPGVVRLVAGKERVPSDVAFTIDEALAREPGKDPDAEESATVQTAMEGKTVAEAAQFLAENGPTEAYRLIADKVRTTLRRLQAAGVSFDLKVAHVGSQVPTYMLSARGAASTRYKPSVSTTVWLNGADVTGKVGVSYETTLHELLHAATQAAVHIGNRKVAENTPLARSVADLYRVTNRIITHFNERVASSKRGEVTLTAFEQRIFEGRANALQSPDEILTWALSNQEMQTYLEGIEVEGQSLWSRFVQAVRTLLGLDASADTALSEVLRVSEEILDAPVEQVMTAVRTLYGGDTAIQSPTGQQVNLQTQVPDPASDAVTALTRAIGREVGTTLPEGTFTLAEAPKNLKPLVDGIAKLTGTKIIFFKAKNSPVAFNGAANIVPGTLFVNVDSTKPHLQIIGHEFLHELKKADFESYAALRDAVRDIIPEKDRMDRWKRLNEKREREGRAPISLVGIEEELVADFFGEQFMSKAFWAKLEKRNPDSFGALVQKFLDFLGRIKSALTGQNLKDVERAQEVAAEAMARYVRRNPQAAFDLKLSEALDPAKTAAFTKWFGDSKVVDEDGEPLVVYHGTKTEFDAFDATKSKDFGIHFGNIDQANTAIAKTKFESAENGRIIPAYLKIENPLELEYDPLVVETEDYYADGTYHNDLLEKILYDATGKTSAWYEGVSREVEVSLDEAFSSADAVDDFATSLLEADDLRDLFNSSEIKRFHSAVGVLIEKLGYDGVIYENELEGAGTSYAVFSPTQIKSVSNQGTFDPENPDIRFSEDLTRSAKGNLSSLPERLRSAKLTSIPMLLKVTPEPILVDTYAHKIPGLKDFADARSRRDYLRNSTLDEFGALYEKIVRAGKKAGKLDQVERLAETASLYQMWPDRHIMDQDWVPKGKTVEARLKAAQTAWEKAGLQESTGKSFQEGYRETSKAWDALDNAELREDYLMAVDYMQRLRRQERDLLQGIIEEYTTDNPELRAEQLGRLDQSFAGLKGAYWPFYRKGDYILRFTDAEGQPVMQTFTSDFERQLAAKDLVAEGILPGSLQYDFRDKQQTDLARIPEGYNAQLGKAIEAAYLEGVDQGNADEVAGAKERAQELERDLTQIWLKWQPETSALKNSIRRRNVRGWNPDMMRGFLEYGQTHGAKAADLQEGRKIERILQSIADQVKEVSATGDAEATRMQMVLNDLREREAAVRKVGVSRPAQVLGQMTTFKYMTSPSIALVQMTQIGVLTLPKLAVMHGPAKAAKALAKGVQEAFSPRFSYKSMTSDETVNSLFDDMRAVMTPELRTKLNEPNAKLGDPVFSQEVLQARINALKPYQRQLLALRESMARNLLDISMAHEMGKIVKGADPESLQNKVFELMMSFMRESEKASRKSTILATFDAAGDTDFFDAMDQVQEVVKSTLYDYSKDAKGVLLQGGTARVLLTFQHFRIMTAFKMATLFRKSFRGQSAEVRSMARKELVGIFGMSGLLAGVFGMPFAPVIFKILDAVLGDDDEPFDFEYAFRQWMDETMGKQAAGVVAEGPASILGAALSRRIGLGDVFGSGSEMPAHLHGDGALAWWTTQMLGPAYSMVSGFAKGYDQAFNEGEVLKGLAAAAPKPLTDMIKAYGLATEGLKTGLGKTLLSADEIGSDEVLMMALGFQPYEVSQVRSREYDRSRMSTMISTRRGQLVQDLVKAEMRGEDTSSEREAILRFNKKMPRFGIGASDIRSMYRQAARRDAGVSTRREMLVEERMRGY